MDRKLPPNQWDVIRFFLNNKIPSIFTISLVLRKGYDHGGFRNEEEYQYKLTLARSARNRMMMDSIIILPRVQTLSSDGY